MPNKTIETVNPATGEKLATYELYSEDMALAGAGIAQRAFEEWGRLSVAKRSEYFRRLASVLRENKADYAHSMTLEMGKPILQAESEIEKCAAGAEYYAENAQKWLEDEFVETDAESSYVSYEPIGVVLSIMPWNFPFWQALRFAIPTLIAGNTSILRHSNTCPGSAIKIGEAFTQAGFPEGVFSVVITDHRAVTKLIESPLTAGVSLTGSTEAGQVIGELAARNFKKFMLELGGSDPFVVLEDANVDRAAEVGATARLQNSGQSCICAKRFIVVRSVAEEFIEKLTKEFEKKKMGNPIEPDNYVGPLVNAGAVETVDSQVKDAIAKGADVVIGGARWVPGYFFEPTILSRIDRKMRVMTEEVFGPVAPICVAENESEAFRIANQSEFGLGASVWTQSISSAKRAVREIQSGMVFVNQLTKSDPRMPFGGIKKSGIGRELSKFGLREFVNVKSINIYGIRRE